jgi:hypothetical protein
MNHPALSHAFSPQRDLLAIHVMKRLTIARTEEHLLTLRDLADELGVRKADVRATISRLHAQGYVDALRMRPTLSGFAIGAALADVELEPLRRKVPAAPISRAA